MEEELDIWDFCRGRDQEREFQWLDGYGLGIELTGNYTLTADFRTTQDPAEAPALSLSESANANGSIIEETDPSVIAATAITTTDDASGRFVVTGAGFQVSQPNVPRDDGDGSPSTPTLLTLDVAEIGDRARVAGSTANNGDLTISEIVDADTIGVLEALVAATGGTLEVIRFGQVRIFVDALETQTLASGTVWYLTVTATDDTTNIGHCIYEAEVRFT